MFRIISQHVRQRHVDALEFNKRTVYFTKMNSVSRIVHKHSVILEINFYKNSLFLNLILYFNSRIQILLKRILQIYFNRKKSNPLIKQYSSFIHTFVKNPISILSIPSATSVAKRWISILMWSHK